MTRERRDADAVSINVTLSRGLVERLDTAAQERVIGRNLLVEKLVAEGLDRLIPVESFFPAARPEPEPEPGGGVEK